MRRTKLTRPALVASLLLLAAPALANGPQGAPMAPGGPQHAPAPQAHDMPTMQPAPAPRPAPEPAHVEQNKTSDLGDVLTAIAAIGVLASVLN